ncbi:dipeptidase PepV [Schnuerera sp. xch1]|uniref:dipeptidase PepV n=1 Tax=Schnuerera sp. xch1 TaxID=2874283 RepID=UPI001CBADB70|nr:dipeptidase PepV [Schnuerera sp. xch1]MBZ2175940.1 dipeptidase PepV [Schnuerera sp. xch1]
MEFNELIENYKEDIIKSTQDIIKIKSVQGESKPNMPFGEGPYKALNFSLDLSKKMGFGIKNIDNYAGHAEIGDGEETVGILVHLDVVPEGDGWTYPPYEAEIHDDRIYGRGTTDDKGPAIACLYAMKALKESKIDLNRKIKIIFGTNEESGWGGIKHYFKHEKAPDMAFTPDADFPVIYGEKGIIVFDLVKKLNSNTCNNLVIESIRGGNAANMVPDYCEAILKVEDVSQIEEKLDNFIKNTKYPLSMERDGKDKVKLYARGISAHGSTPEKGKNAISYLMAFLGKLLEGECDICEFINMYNDRIGFRHNGESIGCSLEDDISGKLNFNPGVIKADQNEIRLSINVRYPIKSSAKEVYDGIRDNLKETGIELIESSSDMKPLYVPKDNFLVEKLMKVYREQTKDVESVPIAIGGGTYARSMENAVAFGPVFPGQKELAHQKDEYISIEHLMRLTKIYAHALYELAK